jgi:hypothetical protein
MYKQLTILAFACALAAGCRDNSTTTTTTPGADMATGGAGGGGGTAGGGGSAGGTGGTGDMAISYTKTTVTSMRTAGTFGTFELDNVVLLAITPSGSALYVQDPAGGNNSAIQVQCSNSAAHKCTLRTTLTAYKVGDAITVQGTYEKGGASTFNFETFYLANATDSGNQVTAPAPATLTMADVIKTAGTASSKYWFQRVQVTLTDDLTVFDYLPAEFKPSTAATACPYSYGFAMQPATGAVTPSFSCATTCSTTPVGAGCTTPVSTTGTNAGELLIGTDFYKGFTYSSDCTCGSGYGDTIVPVAGKVASGSTIAGILEYDSTSTAGYTSLSPTSGPTLVAGTSLSTTPDFVLQ